MERNDKVIAAISFLFLALISFLLIRMEMGTIRDFVMNKNAVKKAKKGQKLTNRFSKSTGVEKSMKL